MKKLKPPLVCDTQKYESIAKRKKYKNTHCSSCKEKEECELCQYGNRGKMLAIKPYVFTRYKEYEENKNAFPRIAIDTILAEDQKELLINTYNSSGFQDIRKRIINNIVDQTKNLCPFCMINTPNTLDHYLPKDYFPEYAIYSKNLIPCCSECNTKKSDRIYNEDGVRKYLHFYFDDIPVSNFLKVKVSFDNSNAILFDIKLEIDDANKVKKVIINHFKFLKLKERYIELFCHRVETFLLELSNYLIDNCYQVDDVLNVAIYRIDALKTHYGNNYWEACLYEGLISKRSILLEAINTYTKRVKNTRRSQRKAECD